MRNVLEYLENSARQSKHYIIDEHRQCTYQQLMTMSQSVGSYLAKDVPKNTPIPVYMEKGVYCLSAFFGTLYAGAFYTLLNPELPQVRLQSIVQQMDTKWIITDKQYYADVCHLFPQHHVLLIEDLIETAICLPLLQEKRKQSLDIDPLYANFTSGSTGIPKGVVINHLSVMHFIEEFTQIFDIGSHDVIGNQAPFDFDVSVKDIYSALLTGATLVIIPKRLFSRPVELLDFICEHHVTTLIWAVSALCLLSTFHGLDYKTPTSVNKVLFSGEVMPMKHLLTWKAHLPNAKFVNLYGPTEITCNCTYAFVEEHDVKQGVLPIGNAFLNKEVFLINEKNEKIVESDVVGEIYVRGVGVALGYYNNVEQTQKQFVQNPLHHRYLDIVYKTGDLAFYNERGQLVFSGRKDFQIKYMGHRIELEEIERAISPYVERVCCLFEKDKIYCFYIGDIDKKELHLQLKEQLPIYMIPSRFRKIETFPLTKNGKIDRRQLIAMIGVKKHG